MASIWVLGERGLACLQTQHARVSWLLSEVLAVLPKARSQSPPWHTRDRVAATAHRNQTRSQGSSRSIRIAHGLATADGQATGIRPPHRGLEMKEFHCILQTKGGIGKSVAAAWLAQYLLNQGRAILAIECDQSNRTLSRYQRLQTERLDLLDKDQQIDRRRFDALMERLVEDTEPTVIMDNGQASFVPLTQYLVECDALSLLEEAGRQSYVHCVVTGGQLGPSTLSGLEQILAAFVDSAHVVVWRNGHFGPIDDEAYQKIVEASGAELREPVHLDRWSKPFEDDVQEMLQRFLTFEEAIHSPDVGLMTRQRLTMVQRRLFGEIQFAVSMEPLEAAHA